MSKDTAETPIAPVATQEDVAKNRVGKWRKATFSYDIGACVECLITDEAGNTYMRDTEHRKDGATLQFKHNDWQAFVEALK